MPSTHVFTLEAANALVPRLAELVGRQLSRRGEVEKLLKELSELVGDVPGEITILDTDEGPIRRIKIELIARIEEYQAGWKEVEATGAVLKDPRIGLLDFYGQVDGRFVWLCWKYGENEVTHYHALDEGYSGRKRIESSAKVRMMN